MILYFRLLWLSICCLFISKKPALKSRRLKFRALPFDCDINLHLNNARYFSFMDLGRWHLLLTSGLFKQVYKRHWLPVMAGIEITFVRPIKPLQKFDLITRVLAWDERYVYMEQRFESKGVLLAIAIVKGIFLSGKKKLLMDEVIHAIEPGLVSPPLPDVVLHWQDLVDIKKRAAI